VTDGHGNQRMTFLPIVERELRVAARRPGIYRSRWLMALGALLLGGVIMGWGDFFSSRGVLSQSQVGGYIFWGLAAFSQLYCLCAGRFSTAECLVIERQQGTLGLLFLTDLKGYDIVLGKLVATSVQAFYGLLALFPVLAIPLVMGGVTNGEFWRVVLALVITFVFSLATGMFASALARTYEQAMARNFYLMLLFAVGPVILYIVVMTFFHDARLFMPLFVFCPIFTLAMGNDADYGATPWYFWLSAAVFVFLTWVFIRRSGRIVSESYREDSVEAKSSTVVAKPAVDAKPVRATGKSSSHASFRKKYLDLNAIQWLTSRPGNKSAHVWIFMLFAGFWWLIMRGLMGREWISKESAVATSVILNLSFKLWVTLESGAWLARDRKSGAFELLLPTPLTVTDMIRGQLLSLRRQFLGPLLATVAVELLLTAVCGEPTGSDAGTRFWSWSAGAFMLVADLTALTGAAMLDAMTAKNPTRAPIKTVLRLLILPWMVVGVTVGSGVFLVRNQPWPHWQPEWEFVLTLWLLTGILADAYFGWRAWQRLLTGFRHLAAGELPEKIAGQTPRRRANPWSAD